MTTSLLPPRSQLFYDTLERCSCNWRNWLGDPRKHRSVGSVHCNRTGSRTLSSRPKATDDAGSTSKPELVATGKQNGIPGAALRHMIRQVGRPTFLLKNYSASRSTRPPRPIRAAWARGREFLDMVRNQVSGRGTIVERMAGSFMPSRADNPARGARSLRRAASPGCAYRAPITSCICAVSTNCWKTWSLASLMVNMWQYWASAALPVAL